MIVVGKQANKGSVNASNNAQHYVGSTFAAAGSSKIGNPPLQVTPITSKDTKSDVTQICEALMQNIYQENDDGDEEPSALNWYFENVFKLNYEDLYSRGQTGAADKKEESKEED